MVRSRFTFFSACGYLFVLISFASVLFFELLLNFGQKSVDFTWVGLLVGYIFCSTDLCISSSPVSCRLEKAMVPSLQYSCLENPTDGGAWWAAVHGIAKSWTRLNDFTFTFHFHALEKEMAAHSSVLAWRIPGTGEPGELLSVGLHRVRRDWSSLSSSSRSIIQSWLL